jgi:Flp pilus assembly protein CpaB
VPVLVARNDLPAGAVLAGSDLVTAAFAPGTQPSAVAETWVGRTLAAPLRRGEPVTDVRLVGPSLTDGYPGLVAAPVRLPDPGAVALLSVGDRVDLYAAHPRSGAARLLVPRAMVLALPAPEPADTASGALTGRLVVLGVDETDVGVIADAAVQDFLTFSFAR